MRYTQFRDLITRELRRRHRGLTWGELRDRLDLPYDRPCPSWVRRLEQEIGLARTRGTGRALIWSLRTSQSR